MLPARRDSVSLTKGRGAAMKPTERRETGQRDMFRSRLDQIIDMGHPLVRLAGKIERKSVVSGKSVSVRVDLGGRRAMKKNNEREDHIREYLNNKSDR